MLGAKKIWDKTMSATLGMAGIKVNREDFLREEFGDDYTRDQFKVMIENRPINIVPADKIDEIANECINYHTVGVTVASFLTGLPGGIAMVASIPADIAQFYWHVLVLSQKLAYLYGYQDLQDKDGEFSEASSHMLTLFVGVMLGYGAARNGLDQLAMDFAKQVATNLPEKILMKAGTLPMLKSVSKKIGFSIERVTAKSMPFLGGLLSGGITYVAFHKGAKRLQQVFRERMLISSNNDDAVNNNKIIDMNSFDAKINRINISTLEILINMAVIDNELDKDEKKYITKFIKKLKIDDENKIKLLFQLNNLKITVPDVAEIKGNVPYCKTLIEGMVFIAKIGSIKPEEKEYLYKIANDLDFNKESVDLLLKSEIMIE